MFSEAMFGGIYESAIGNNSELDGITLENADYVGTSLAEHAIQSMYEFQMNMTNIDAAAVCEEYMYLKENGVEMIGESAWDTIKGWFEKVKEAIIALWNRITSFFKSVFKKIDEFITNDTVWVKAYENKISEISGTVQFLHPVKMPVDKDVDISSMTKSYDDLGITFGKVNSLDSAKTFIGSKSHQVGGEREGTFTLGDGSHYKYTLSAANEKEFIKVFTKNLPCGEVETIEAYKKGMAKHYKESKDKITSASSADLKKALEFVSKFYDTKKELKKSYDKNKKIIDKSLTMVKNYEKSCEKDEKDLPAAKAAVKFINTGLSLLTATNSLNVQLINTKRTQSKALIKEAVASYKKDKKEKDKEVEESARILSGLELL